MERWITIKEHNNGRKSQSVCVEALENGQISLYVDGARDAGCIHVSPEQAMQIATTLAEAVTELER